MSLLVDLHTIGGGGSLVLWKRMNQGHEMSWSGVGSAKNSFSRRTLLDDTW